MAYTYKNYEESEAVKKAQEALQAQLSREPGDYRSAWEEALKGAMDAILSREDFRYDPASDPMYRNYREEYVKNGSVAMLDTLGKGQAMTGGYGNSYAQSAAQQTYGSYIQELNSRIPELYSLALSRYEAEGDALSDRLAAIQSQDSQDYGRWEDALQQWQDQRDFLADQEAYEREQDYSQYEADRDFAFDVYESDRDYAFDVEKEAEDNRQWQAEFDEEQRQYNETQASKGSSSSSGGSYSGNGGVDTATVRAAQEFVGTTADGMWGKNSKAAAKAMGYNSLQEVIEAMGGSTYEIEDPVAAVKNLAQAGTDEYQLNAYIAKLTAQGKLTQAEAASLRKTYISPKYYY